FLESTDSVCPGCSTGCNIHVDHRDGEAQRLRPRRNVEVNKSWMCDVGRTEYKELSVDARLGEARIRNTSGALEQSALAVALDRVGQELKAAGAAAAFMA